MTFCRTVRPNGRWQRGRTIFVYLFKVDLGVSGHPCVADEVDDPFLAFVWGEVEACREVAFM